MKTTIRVKNEDAQPMLPGIIITLIFFAAGIGAVTVSYIKAGGSFRLMMYNDLLMLLFAVVLLAFSGFFVYLLIKPPKAYSAVLEERSQTDEGIRLVFSAGMRTHICYADEDMPLTEGLSYTVYIKQFNNKITAVDPDGFGGDDPDSLNPTLVPVYAAVIFIFGTAAIISAMMMLNDLAEGKFDIKMLIPTIFCGAMAVTALIRCLKKQ